MDLSAFLQDHEDSPPSGENLEYDPAFIALELAAQPGEERQIGESIIEAEEPDWAEVILQSRDILARSHDLRAAVFLTQALLRTEGFPGFADGTGLIRGMLETYWDTCHPLLDADDDDDPTMRINAVTALGGTDTVVKWLRITPLADSRSFGRFSMRDLMVLDGEITQGDTEADALDASQVGAAFQDTRPETLAAIRAAISKAAEDVKAVGAIFGDRTPGQGPDLQQLERMLSQILRKLNGLGFGDPDAVASDDGGEGEGAGMSQGRGQGGPVFGGGGGGGGAINTQADVRATLDRLIGYYKRSEPSSPVPMLLERAKRMVGADFLSIIKDMAPDGRANVYLVGGIVDED